MKLKVKTNRKHNTGVYASLIAIVVSIFVLSFLSLFQSQKYNAALVHYSELRDGGFNEQSLDALNAAENEVESSTNYDYAYTTVKTSTTPTIMVNTYQALLENNTDILIGSGWLNSFAFYDEVFANDLANSDSYAVYVDDEYGEFYNNGDGTSHVISLHFQAEEASFIAGVAAGMYLTTKFADPNDWKTTTWGGAFSSLAVLNYMSGYKAGIDFVNAYLASLTSPIVTGRIEFVTPINGGGNPFETWYTNSWDADQSATNASKVSIENGAKVIFPVAGAQTFNALYEASINEDVLVIGVDTPVELVYPQYSEQVLTSANKNINSAIYGILMSYFNISNGIDQSYVDYDDYIATSNGTSNEFQIQDFENNGVGYNHPQNGILEESFQNFKLMYPSPSINTFSSFDSLIESLFANPQYGTSYCIEDVDPYFLDLSSSVAQQLIASSDC